MTVTDDFERPQPLVSVLIEAHGSTIEFATVSETHVGVWDDPLVRWDDPDYLWDGTPVTMGPGPAFEGIGFQADAFPVSVVNHIVVDATLPALTQSATGRSSEGIAQIALTLPAISQEATLDVSAIDEACSELQPLTQASEETLTVTAFIGNPNPPWQADAFQPDAFRTVGGHGQILPAFTQHAIAFKLGAGEGFAESVLPAFTSDADVSITVNAAIPVELPALRQSAEVSLNPIGTIESTLPALTQLAVCAVQILPDLAGINLTLPALQQSFRVGLEIWSEWEVTTGEEWRVREHV